MSDLVWIAGIFFLIVPGLSSWRLSFVRRLDLGARLAIAFAAGVAIAAVLMYAYSLAGVPWSRVTIGVPLLLVAVCGFVGHGCAVPNSRGFGAAQPRPTIIMALFLLLTLYGVATARET